MRCWLNIILVLVLVLTSCTSQKDVIIVSPEPEVSVHPSWIRNRPLSSMHYIGIGRSPKTGPMEEYTMIAKRNALSDLAGEIEVRITANSLLYTLEHDDSFSESYTEHINTETSLDLEGFEISDVWEDDSEYWVYYRLDKEVYRSVLAQRKSEAVSQSISDLDIGRKAQANGNIVLAAEQFVKAIIDLESYWGEDNISPEREDVGPVDKAALYDLMGLRDALVLKPSSEILVLNESNGFEKSLRVEALLDSEPTEPLLFMYRQGKGEEKSISTAVLNLRVKPGDEDREILSIAVDPFAELRERLKENRYSFLRPLLNEKVIQPEVQVDYPSLSVKSMEFMDGSELGSDLNVLVPKLLSELTKRGLASNEQSPYQITLLAKSRNGGQNQGFQVVYTDLILEAKDSNKGEMVFSETFPNVKGVHKTLEDARKKSLDKAVNKIDQELLKALLDGLF